MDHPWQGKAGRYASAITGNADCDMLRRHRNRNWIDHPHNVGDLSWTPRDMVVQLHSKMMTGSNKKRSKQMRTNI